MTRQEACDKLWEVATAELGVHETPGTVATKRIQEYQTYTTYGRRSDEIPWCSDFANFVVDTAGWKGTRSASAKSWRDWGVVLEFPIKGCIVILPRNDPNNVGAAHVTFCNDPDITEGFISCIGGNQGDAVKVSSYKINGAQYRSPV